MRIPRFRSGIRDPVEAYEHELDLDVRRRQVYDIIDNSPVQVWVVVVAGAGFFTDAYDIFAVNTVLPMISFVYWGGWYEKGPGMPSNIFTALLCATLAGSMIGQMLFGILGDIFGRRQAYFYLLLIILWATLGLAASADGSNGSMSLVGWLFSWRFFMGIGIGGDYPLSATITSEFAPKGSRARMLAWLFFMQPFGQFIANVVAAVVTASFHSRTQCQYLGYSESSEDLRAVDRSWRLIVGIGGLWAIFAMIIRYQIPESPRYTLDVVSDGDKALKDTREYFGGEHRPTEGEQRSMEAGVNPRHGGVTHRNTQERRHVAQRERSQTRRRFTFCGWCSGFKTYFCTEGNWTHLVGTMAAWCLLDAAFYGLGFSSSWTIQKLWEEDSTATSSTFPPSTTTCPATPTGTGPPVYFTLKGNAWHPMVVVSLPALLGGLAMTYVVQHSRPVKVQSLFFGVLACLFFLIGGLFQLLFNNGQGSQHWGLVAFYIFCQFFFNMGPNATTFIIPAEQFKTQYRCTAHGLSAAFGKFGSIIGQLIIGLSGANNKSSDKLWYIFLIFGVFMLFGVVVTQLAVPDSRDARGNSMSLEDLARGVIHMTTLRKRGSGASTEPQWWNRWHTLPVDESCQMETRTGTDSNANHAVYVAPGNV